MLPILYNFPGNLIIGAGVGCIYSCFFKTDLKLTACAFAINRAADTLVFAIANPICQGDAGIRSLKVYIFSSTIVMVASIIAFRRLKLIATLGTLVAVGITLRNILKQVSVLQFLEDQKAEGV